MAVDNSLRATSLELYQFLCQHIVGTKETVRIKRLMNNILDNVLYNDYGVVITSGSRGEGLELKGSDVDIMCVNKQFIVHEDTPNVKCVPKKINLVMETNDTKPGFTQLRLLNTISNASATLAQMFEQRGNSWYLSSKMFKLVIQKTRNKGWGHRFPNIHGPCLSDSNETIDLAYSLHNPHWIQAAGIWMSRVNTSWPSSDVTSDVIDHGVLYVPIGSKGSNEEELEWRISFSVAEKMLIYSFSHTQLLSYALMKILLKDLINSNINCKNLLCSYFIKTIVFWVSEEIPVTEWKPENLAQCFMRCFRRLLYCVEFSMCPHYFIPINNMFENKIEGQPRQFLLEHLNALFSFGWRCVLFSEQLKSFSIHSIALPGSIEFKGTQLKLILLSYASAPRTEASVETFLRYKKCIRILSVNKTSVIKLTCLRIMSSVCSASPKIIVFPYINKRIYSKRRTQLAYLVQSIHHDAVSGWIKLAAFFYKMKHYRTALYILSYAIMKCTPEKVYLLDNGQRLSQIQLNMTTSTTLQRSGTLRILKLVTMNPITFYSDSTQIPDELEFKLNFSQFPFLPPAIFAQFLCFLCHYHLNEIQQCYMAIREMQQTIENRYFLTFYPDVFKSYSLFATALLLFNEKDPSTAFIIMKQVSRKIEQTIHEIALLCVKSRELR